MIRPLYLAFPATVNAPILARLGVTYGSTATDEIVMERRDWIRAARHKGCLFPDGVTPSALTTRRAKG